MFAKICGVTNKSILEFLIHHKNPPMFIGFICNYPKSKRNLSYEKLKFLINIKKNKKINFVSVLVDPSDYELNKVAKLRFDYLQLYDVNPKRTLKIKKKFKTKIITAITIENFKDVKKYNNYKNISDIILFDSKGYNESLSFNHELMKIIPLNIKKMIAGDIRYNDNLAKFKKISDIIDISVGLETQGEKDIKKINIFLNNIKKI